MSLFTEKYVFSRSRMPLLSSRHLLSKSLLSPALITFSCSYSYSFDFKSRHKISRISMSDSSTPSSPSDPPPKSRLYTRTGDKGTSSLFNGRRAPKTDALFEALGTIDELSAAIGIAHCYADPILKQYFAEIQSRLLDCGSSIATPANDEHTTPAAIERTRFADYCVNFLESWTDILDSKLPPLKNFILPGGDVGSSHIHLARAICRRAERRVVALHEQDLVEASICIYLNRLSDFLFAAARYQAMVSGAHEVVYKKGEPPKVRLLSEGNPKAQ